MSTEPDDLDAFLAEKSTDPAFALHWEALQATNRPATTDLPDIPVGTPVRYWPGARDGDGRVSRTRTTVRPWSDHKTWVVWVDGYPGCIALTHVEVITEDELAAVRASQGHQEPASVPDGPGAAQGADGGSAAESEPRPMRPEDVPGKILVEALEAWTGYDGDPLNDCDPEDVETAATILAAAYPAIGEHLAAAIEANPSGECSGAVAECARLVRNLTRGDQ